MLSELKVRLISVYSILLMTLTHISCCSYHYSLIVIVSLKKVWQK